MNHNRKLLHRSFDDNLTADEQQALERALQSSGELRQEKKRLEKLRDLTPLPDASFEPYFAERIVAAIKLKNARIQQDFFSALNYMFRRIALVGVIAVVVLSSFTLLHKSHSTSIADYAMTRMTLDELVDPTMTTSLEDIL